MRIKQAIFHGFLVSLFVFSLSFAQGINFITGSFPSALESARRANKLLFVEVYLTGCPHCAALAPVLEEKKVGDYFNQNFISYKVEANSDDSKMMQQQKGITYVEFPLFFFFDPNSGQLIHQAAPGEHPTRAAMIDEVLKHGQEALSPATRTSSYPSRYAKGERDLLFLVNYAKNAKATKDNDKLHQLNNDIAKAFTKPADLESATGFYVISRLINDFSNPMAVYFFKNLEKYKAKFPAKDVKDAGELITYHTLYFGKRANQLDYNEVVQIREAMVRLGIPKMEAHRRTILKELEALLRDKQTAQAANRLNDYIKIAKMTFQDYAYLVRYFNEKSTDNSYVSSLLKWVDSGLKLVTPKERNSKELADFYLEQSKAYLKVGNKVEAKKAATNAVNTAKVAKIDVKPYNDSLVRIK